MTFVVRSNLHEQREMHCKCTRFVCERICSLPALPTRFLLHSLLFMDENFSIIGWIMGSVARGGIRRFLLELRMSHAQRCDDSRE